MKQSTLSTNVASLTELALLFLRLGLTAFGGPAAHIALMEEEVVRRRAWLTREKFLDLVGTASLLPGPSSTEVALYIGFLRAGALGLLIAGMCFILPAALIVTGLAWTYVHFGHYPQIAGVLYGVKPVVIAVIAQALWGLGRTALKSQFLAAVGGAVLLATALGISPLPALVAAGAFAVLGHAVSAQERRQAVKPLLGLLSAGLLLTLVPLAVSKYTTEAPRTGLVQVFLAFLKFGSVVYGSGYVLLAFLRDDLVTRRHWLTTRQLLDAVAVGQVTPGPVFTTATFIGYIVAGWKGALLATIGMFVPSFLLVAVSGPFIARIRSSPVAGAFLDGVNVASLALMALVTWQLGCAALVDEITVALAIAGAILLLRFRVNSTWLVLGGALLGLLITMVRAKTGQ